MAIIPTVRCRRMEKSIAFYTEVLDFECVEGGADSGAPPSAFSSGKGLHSSSRVIAATAHSGRRSSSRRTTSTPCFASSGREGSRRQVTRRPLRRCTKAPLTRAGGRASSMSRIPTATPYVSRRACSSRRPWKATPERVEYSASAWQADGGPEVRDRGKGLHVYRGRTNGSWKLDMDIWNSDNPIQSGGELRHADGA